MAHFGSSQRPTIGQRRDSSVMSISSLIDSRAGDGYSRVAGASNRPMATAHIGSGASIHISARSFQIPRSVIPPSLPPLSPPETTEDEDEDELDWHSNTLAPKSPSRDPRPSYTEEQKFFIMWARIVQEKGWTDIEDDFTRIFNQRTKGGLTSVYYRIRKSWKLKDVLSSDPGSSDADRRAVAARASNFSRGFLREIGYVM